jgi:hypothetical protein
MQARVVLSDNGTLGPDNPSVLCNPHSEGAEGSFTTDGYGSWAGTVTINSTGGNWSDDVTGNLRLLFTYYNEQHEMYLTRLSDNRIFNFQVQNDALVIGAHKMAEAPYDPKPCVDNVAGFLFPPMKHTVHPTVDEGRNGDSDNNGYPWYMDMTEDNIKSVTVSGIAESTVFYMLTHGTTWNFGTEENPDWHYAFGDGKSDDPSDWTEPLYDGWIWDWEANAAVLQKTASQPHYNFVFLDTCHSADVESDGTDIAFLNLGAWMSWGIWPDCALVGWVGTREKSGQFDTFAYQLFNYLNQGYTITYAKMRALSDAGLPAGMEKSRARADPAMRLHWPFLSLGPDGNGN